MLTLVSIVLRSMAYNSHFSHMNNALLQQIQLQLQSTEQSEVETGLNAVRLLRFFRNRLPPVVSVLADLREALLTPTKANLENAVIKFVREFIDVKQ